MPGDRLIIFVKAPRPGHAKTRLAKDLGPIAAAQAYRQLVHTLLDQLRSIEPVELLYDPPDAAPEIDAWLKPGWTARPQTKGDLSVRLRHAFASDFAAGFSPVIIIGSDTPAITAPDIRLAWQMLASHDLVLGPASDGGYWLIGLNRLAPTLFDHIPWSSAEVLQTTLARAGDAQLRVHLLHELSDVDTLEDWNRFVATRPQPVSLQGERS